MADPAMNGPQEPGLDAVLATLRGLLTAGETLEAWAVQHRLFALTHRRDCIAATSGRFISLNRRLLGGYQSADIRWQDLRETRISAGILSADLTLVAQSSTDLNIGSEVNRVWTFAGLCKDQAQAILGGRFAYVAQRPGDALEFVKAAMQSHGLTDQSRVTVLADGADGLASLVKTASPEGAQSILDWFHISMRLRSIEQMAPKVAGVLKEQDPDAAALSLQKVPRIRYQMWNGRWIQAVKRMHTIYDAAKRNPETGTPGDRERLQRFRQHLFDLHEYLMNNWKSLTNYAYAYRHGLRI